LLEDHVLIIYILYTIYKCLVALQSAKFKFFQVSSLLFSLWIESPGRPKSGMAGQSPAIPDNV
jgi:hypothetical protein